VLLQGQESHLKLRIYAGQGESLFVVSHLCGKFRVKAELRTGYPPQDGITVTVHFKTSQQRAYSKPAREKVA